MPGKHFGFTVAVDVGYPFIIRPELMVRLAIWGLWREGLGPPVSGDDVLCRRDAVSGFDALGRALAGLR